MLANSPGIGSKSLKMKKSGKQKTGTAQGHEK
jgi:hypothetical protein